MLFKCHEEQALLNLFNELQSPKSDQWLREGRLNFVQLSSISVVIKTGTMYKLKLIDKPPFLALRLCDIRTEQGAEFGSS